MTKRINDKFERHHIIPRSRKGLGKTNITYVESYKHRQYHNLFSNMTPPEIVKYLNSSFWSNHYRIRVKEKVR